MKPKFHFHSKEQCKFQFGFVFMELLVVLAVLGAIIAAILLPALSGAKQKAQRINCVNNLKQIGLGFRIWANDNQDLFPMQVPYAKGGSQEAIAEGKPEMHFRAMRNELNNPRILACASDNRQPAQSFQNLTANNISYFVGVDAKSSSPMMMLAGDRNVQNGLPVQKTLLELQPDRGASWTGELHNQVGNVGLADGSVQQVTSARLNGMLKDTKDPLNRIQLPVLMPE